MFNLLTSLSDNLYVLSSFFPLLPKTRLVGRSSGTVPVQNHPAVPRMVHYRINPAIPTPKYTPRTQEHTETCTGMFTTECSLEPQWAITQMSITWWMDKQNVVYAYNGTWLSNKSKQSTDTCYNTGEAWKDYAFERSLRSMCCRSPFIINVLNRQIHRQKTDEWLPGAGEWGKLGGWWLRNRVECSYRVKKNPKVDCGDG